MKLSQNIEPGDTVIKICLYVITRKLRGPQWNKGLGSGRDRDLSLGEMAGNWSANPPFRDIRPRRTKPRPYTHRRRPVYRLFSWGSTTANNSWLLEIPVRHTDPFSDKGIQKKKKKWGEIASRGETHLNSQCDPVRLVYLCGQGQVGICLGRGEER